ncbi:hypothetical Protein YC6258_02783 [Gynuella sunshinyii YC6258]|uniref:Uncharacterized protein n=1 Tax=Gynuella sunshinyii YC6258 TaxID=1445510 RepID=A0A0C5VKL3_9GAMM|nr:hypothetical Protein YC6258_02783 [Gynuella sunshinyii YC6258]
MLKYRLEKELSKKQQYMYLDDREMSETPSGTCLSPEFCYFHTNRSPELKET